MLAANDIHRSIAGMTIDMHRLMEHRKHRGDFYGLGEVEFQAQYSFSGQVNSLPAENQLKIPFTVYFVGDPGNQRDSTLDRPHARLTPELSLAPAGSVPYAYVARWLYDDDFNYTGAVVTIGVHSPAAAMGEMPADTNFQGILHAAFQGYGCLWDPDGPFDAGGN